MTGLFVEKDSPFRAAASNRGSQVEAPAGEIH